ncbi:hypothetical protein ACFP3Q_02635 [Nocardioides sp. GCM10027113]|uniref:hypothetical protein n=1 Tax=unclassified Nocardioides TaxID=2615069 RepID=UPI0036078C1B
MIEPDTTEAGRRAAEGADKTLSAAFWVGLGVAVVGGAIYGVNRPRVDYDVDPLLFEPTVTGDAGGATFGLFVVGAGCLIMFIALVGWGVKLGILAAHHSLTAPPLAQKPRPPAPPSRLSQHPRMVQRTEEQPPTDPS